MTLFNVKIHWRTLQICINILSVVTGFCSFLPLGYVTKMFINQCVLYGDVKLLGVGMGTIQVDLENSKWGSLEKCNFAIFSTVITSIHAFIWCWFFLCMKAELKMERAEFPFLLASFLMHGSAMIAVFISSGVISAGIDTWCSGVARELDSKTSGNMLESIRDFSESFPLELFKGESTCEESESYVWDLVGEQYSFYKFLLVSKISSWLCVVTVMCQFLVCGYKLYVWALQTTFELGSAPQSTCSTLKQNGVQSKSKTNMLKPSEQCPENSPSTSAIKNEKDYIYRKTSSASESSADSLAQML